MKILITTEFYVPAVNGVVISVLALQNELCKRGHDVRVLTLSNSDYSYLEGNVSYIRSISADKVYPGARITLHMRDALVDDLIDWHPDLIHSQSEFSTFFIAQRISRKLHIPIIHTYHTLYKDYTHYLFPNPKIGESVTAYLTRKLLNHVQLVIAPTEKVKNILSDYGVRKEIKIVPTGIDSHRFDIPLETPELRCLLKRVGIPEGHKVIVTVGRLAKEKNMEEIILFLSKLGHSKITLLIVGDGPYRVNLEEYARRMNASGWTIFTGMIAPDKIADYYRLGDVFVSASTSETQGLTYIEALTAGVPVLCRKDPCLDHVIWDGVNGWQYTSYEEFSDYLEIMMDQDEIHSWLSENARIGARREYSSAVFAERILELYKELLCGSNVTSTEGLRS